MTPWTVAHQPPLSMEFSRQEYCSGMPFPSLEDLTDPGIESASLRSAALAGRPRRQAPLSMEFPRKECWSGLPCPSPGDLPDPGIKLMALMAPVLTGRFFTTSATREAP